MNKSEYRLAKNLITYPVSINSVFVRSDGHNFTSRKLSSYRFIKENYCEVDPHRVTDPKICRSCNVIWVINFFLVKESL